MRLTFSTRHWSFTVDLGATNALQESTTGDVVFTGGLPGDDEFVHPVAPEVANAFHALKEAFSDVVATLAVPQGTVEWDPERPGLVEFWRDGRKQVFALFPEERARLQERCALLREAINRANPYLSV